MELLGSDVEDDKIDSKVQCEVNAKKKNEFGKSLLSPNSLKYIKL